MSPEEDQTRDAVDSEPKHYQLSYSGPNAVTKIYYLNTMVLRHCLAIFISPGRKHTCQKYLFNLTHFELKILGGNSETKRSEASENVNARRLIQDFPCGLITVLHNSCHYFST